MKFAVVGAGAIGAYIGAKLHQSGQEVHLIARGPHLAAMRANGVRVTGPEEDFTVHPNATGDPREIGVVDYVILTVKAHGLKEVAPTLGPLLGDRTAIVSTQNGIPWWYFYGLGPEWEGMRLESVDPGGVVSEAIDPRRVIGCIVYPAAVVSEPGVVRHVEGDRLTLGEPDGSETDRAQDLAAAFSGAGFRCRVRKDIRNELWVKLLGNLVFNPVSALTGATLEEMATHPETAQLARCVMKEADAVAEALGVKMPVSIDRRMAGAEKVGSHKTSMLQDLEAGRPMELGPLVGAVVELGEMVDVPMPYTKSVYACAKLLSQVRDSKAQAPQVVNIP